MMDDPLSLVRMVSDPAMFLSCQNNGWLVFCLSLVMMMDDPLSDCQPCLSVVRVVDDPHLSVFSMVDDPCCVCQLSKWWVTYMLCLWVVRMVGDICCVYQLSEWCVTHVVFVICQNVWEIGFVSCQNGVWHVFVSSQNGGWQMIICCVCQLSEWCVTHSVFVSCQNDVWHMMLCCVCQLSEWWVTYDAMLCFSVVGVVEERDLSGLPDPPGGELQSGCRLSSAELPWQGWTAQVTVIFMFMPGLSMSLISWYISNLHENLLILCDEDHLSVGQFWQSFNQEFVIVINMSQWLTVCLAVLAKF